MDTEWIKILNTEFDEHVDIQGNSVYPIKKISQWLLYNHYCFNSIKNEEELELEELGEHQIKELTEFWNFTKKETKKDNTYLCIYKSRDEYKLMAYYRDKIKSILQVKGEVYE